MRILFQGDSITDAGRDRSDYHNMGPGYPKYASEAIAGRHPQTEFEFINLGIGGHQTADLCARWKEDCTDLMPDVVSVLIGINDVWHRSETKEWLDNGIFEKNYRFLLDEIKEKTQSKIIMLEPFLLYCEDKAFFREDLDFKIDIVRALAREYADIYIPLDGIFAAASVSDAPPFWAEDGVHPTSAGAKLIAKHYADAFDRIFESLVK
ncbi:MAG: SGNH/GDSL hydrolase family protein [Candidatus Avispirillum sp.]